ncbi:hypothetical protein [Bacteroides acidifaciens]|uniref:hypothetical protein n=1 Tax=Bacteroides acidifaciens TaxID=85831 RepID=UPI00248B7D94|nr:hypothetical protein [Bacteroides acidifaciens]
MRVNDFLEDIKRIPPWDRTPSISDTELDVLISETKKIFPKFTATIKCQTTFQDDKAVFYALAKKQIKILKTWNRDIYCYITILVENDRILNNFLAEVNAHCNYGVCVVKTHVAYPLIHKRDKLIKSVSWFVLLAVVIIAMIAFIIVCW